MDFFFGNLDANGKFTGILGIHEVHLVDRKTSKKDTCGQGVLYENSGNYQTLECVARSMDQNWRSRSERKNSKNGKEREANTRQRSKVERHLLY